VAEPGAAAAACSADCRAAAALGAGVGPVSSSRSISKSWAQHGSHGARQSTAQHTSRAGVSCVRLVAAGCRGHLAWVARLFWWLGQHHETP
jgi:hypothetical protein